MYKLENLDLKIKKTFTSIENLVININKSIKDQMEYDEISELKLQNNLLLCRVKDLENKYHQWINSSLSAISPKGSPNNVADKIRQIKHLHSIEINDLQTSHEKEVFYIKDLFKQKEQRLKERIDFLSQSYGNEDNK